MGLKALRGRLSISPPLILVVLMMTATSLAKAEDKLAPEDAACPGGVCPGLGNAFYLPDLNALSTPTGGTKIFINTTLKKKCATFNRNLGQASRNLNVEASMNSFVQSVSTSLSLGGTRASKQMSVQASARVTTGSESSYTGTFHTAQLDIRQVFATVDLKSECWDAGNLNPDFLKAFESLTLFSPTDATKTESWNEYVEFLRTHGSHFMTQQQIGSRFQQWESSTSNESNIESKLRARACASVEGRAAGKKKKPKWDVSGCAKYSKETRESATDFAVHSQRVIRGGTDETRNALAKGVTQERIDAFIDSGRLGNQAIGYTFRPIWELLNRVYQAQCSPSTAGSPACQDLQRSRNLQAAYEGRLAIRCTAERSGSYAYQEMRIVGEPDRRGIYSYQCWARKIGCADSGGCRIGGSGSVCYCHGPSCFDLGEPVDSPGRNRTAVRGTQSGRYNQGVNQSCTYQIGIRCRCNESWNGGFPDRPLYLQSSE